MEKIIFACIVFGACVAVTSGIDVSNYEISRNKLGSGGPGYGNYYPGYGPGYPGGYPGAGVGGGAGYPGGYPGGGVRPPISPVPPGPPGAHPGCPLCDSSVYSYCSHKEAHDSCCCGGGSYGYGCRKTDCNFLYANSCQEFNLISSCCCVDLYKNGAAPLAAAVPVVA